MHVPPRGQRVGAQRLHRGVGGFIRLRVHHAARLGDLGAAKGGGALRAAVAHQHRVALARLQSHHGGQNVRHKAGAAQHGAIDVAGVDPQILGHRHRPHGGQHTGGAQTVDVAHLQTSIGHRGARGAGQYFHLGKTRGLAATKGGHTRDNGAAAQGFQARRGVHGCRCGRATGHGLGRGSGCPDWIKHHHALTLVDRHAGLHTLAHLHGVDRVHVHTAHQAHAFVQINQADVVIAARVGFAAHRGHRIHRAQTRGGHQAQVVAAAMRADLTREINVLVTALAMLDHKVAFIEGGLVLREHTFCVVAHRVFLRSGPS